MIVRIAQVAPLSVRMPPRKYGGSERVVHALTEELVRRGHDVVVFGSGTSETSGRLIQICPRPLWELPISDPLAYRVLQVEELVRWSDEFDVIHGHVDYLPWLAAGRLRAPMVTTMHGSLDLPEYRPLFATHPEQALVSISDCQRRPLADLDLNWVGTVHQGLELAGTYQLGAGDGAYLVFLGRISPEKGPQQAIRVALRAGMPIKLAARVDPVDEAFFEREVQPFLEHPLVHWLGEVDDAEKVELLRDAAALLMPIQRDEPFGIAFIEAMAAGTPVITHPRGSVPELLRHGVHGFIVPTEDEMVDACRRVGEIDRGTCRRHALARFSVERMTDDYERIYGRVVARRTWSRVAATERLVPSMSLRSPSAPEPVPVAGNGFRPVIRPN